MRKDERIMKDLQDLNLKVEDILNIVLKTIGEPIHRETIETIDLFNTIYILEQENKQLKDKIDKAIEYIKHSQSYGTMAQVMPHLKTYVNGDNLLVILGEKDENIR